MKKTVLSIHPSPKGHWVGDGFPVRSLFTYQNEGQPLSPFLLLDYAGPAEFAPAARPRGVGEHPHRGFETVTIVYAGEVAHRDSAGNGGRVGPGDVQWMTAAAGILHEEFHSPAFTRRGGKLEMAQLWVNLPASQKMSPPRYQTLLDAVIPTVVLPHDAGRVRVIAGVFNGRATPANGIATGAAALAPATTAAAPATSAPAPATTVAAQARPVTGPARTATSLNVWDVALNASGSATLSVPDLHNTAIAILRGSITVNGSTNVQGPAVVVLSRSGEEIAIQAGAEGEALILLLSGEPIVEPVVGYGPFVMNSQQEIATAMEDFRAGKFGKMPPPETSPRTVPET